MYGVKVPLYTAGGLEGQRSFQSKEKAIKGLVKKYPNMIEIYYKNNDKSHPKNVDFKLKRGFKKEDI